MRTSRIFATRLASKSGNRPSPFLAIGAGCDCRDDGAEAAVAHRAVKGQLNIQHAVLPGRISEATSLAISLAN